MAHVIVLGSSEFEVSVDERLEKLERQGSLVQKSDFSSDLTGRLREICRRFLLPIKESTTHICGNPWSASETERGSYIDEVVAAPLNLIMTKGIVEELFQFAKEMRAAHSDRRYDLIVQMRGQKFDLQNDEDFAAWTKHVEPLK